MSDQYGGGQRSIVRDDDDMGVIALWDILVRRRVIFAIVFLISIAAGAVWLVYDYTTSQPKYEARAAIRSALVGNELFDTPIGWEEAFVERHGLSRYQALTTVQSLVERPGLQPRAKEIAVVIELGAEKSDADAAEKELSTAISELVETQMAWYNFEFETLKHRYELSQRVFAHFNEFLVGETEASMPPGRAEGGSNVTAEALARLPEIYERASALERMQDYPYTRPVEVIDSVWVVEVRNGIAPMVIIIVSLISGLISSVLIAMFSDSIIKSQERT